MRLPDRVLEVTQYDRELFYRKFPPELRATAEQLPFAAVKPPFEAGLTSPPARLAGEEPRSGRLGAPLSCGRSGRAPDPGDPGAGLGRIVAVGADAALVAERVRDGTRFIAFRHSAAAAAAFRCRRSAR